jgi:hypothetical protein
MGGIGIDPKSELLLDSPRDTAANTDMARRAGCSHWGQSAPVEFIGWSLSNLWLQVGQ